MNRLTHALAAAALVTSLAACSDDDEPTSGGAIGVPRAEAGCAPIRTEPFETPANGSHHIPQNVDPGYDDAPPAAALHHDPFPMGAQLKNYYKAADRPPVPDVVHLTEHGYNILWYDESLAGDDDLAALADAHPIDEHFVLAPWTSDDGADFPDGAHVALTHWTGGDSMEGVWQYCEKLSGEVVDEFTTEYTKANSPEPEAP